MKQVLPKLESPTIPFFALTLFSAFSVLSSSSYCAEQSLIWKVRSLYMHVSLQ